MEFHNIKGDADQTLNIEGLSQSLIENIKLSDINITSKNGLIIKYATNLEMSQLYDRKAK